MRRSPRSRTSGSSLWRSVLKGLAEAGAARGAGAPRSDSPLTAEQRRALRRELARPEFAQVRRLYKRLLVRHGIYSYAEIDAT